MQPQFYSENPTPYMAPQPKQGFWSKRKLLLIGAALFVALSAVVFGIVSAQKSAGSNIVALIYAGDDDHSYSLLGDAMKTRYSKDRWKDFTLGIRQSSSSYKEETSPGNDSYIWYRLHSNDPQRKDMLLGIKSVKEGDKTIVKNIKRSLPD